MADTAHRALLITVDSLRADVLGLYGGPCATPNLAALADEGVVYRQAFATGPHTTQSFPGILASNYPTTGGTVQNLGSRVSVAEHFQAAGFRTAGFHSNPLLSRHRGYGRGFNTFWDSLGDVPSVQAVGGAHGAPGAALRRLSSLLARRCPPLFRMGRRVYRALARRVRHVDLPHTAADEVNRRALSWLAEAGDRTFLWLHYMDPHWPYATRLPGTTQAERREAMRLSDRALRRPGSLTAGDLDRLRAFYLREVAYVDKCLGRLFAAMRARGLWDGLAVVFTADHGQAFAEHGTTFHGDLLYDELIRVPLIIRAPGLEPGWRGLASLIDVAPTLCALAGVEAGSTFEGRQLTQQAAREEVFAETAYRMFTADEPKRLAVRSDGWKLIRNAEEGTEELYDLAADPGEQRNVLPGRPAVAARLRELADAHVRRDRPRIDRRPEPPASAAEDETVRARLRALGYVDERGD